MFAAIPPPPKDTLVKLARRPTKPAGNYELA